jgi:hypothetical protein
MINSVILVTCNQDGKEWTSQTLYLLSQSTRCWALRLKKDISPFCWFKVQDQKSPPVRPPVSVPLTPDEREPVTWACV